MAAPRREDDDQPATVLEKPSSKRAFARAQGSSSSPVAGPASLQALLVDEVARAKGIAKLFVLLTFTAGAWFIWLGGVRWLQIAATVVIFIFGCVNAYVAVRAKPDASYRVLYRVWAGTAVTASAFVMYYVGVFSPAPIAVMLGISFYGTSADRTWAIGVCIVASTIYSSTTLGIALGWIPDLGLIRGPESVAIQSFAIVLVPIVFLGTLGQARLSRKTAVDAMAQVEAAAQVVQARDAQLAEANLDLEKALELGAGLQGRHSGRRTGSWLLGEIIGRGAMGEVYAAVDDRGTRAAVKTLIPSTEPDQLARFRREAEIASAVRSPGLVNVLEVGALDGAVPYIVMELLQGHDLAYFLRKTRSLEIPDVVALCEQVAVGLRDAHAAGIIHRDIKPQNLFRHEPPNGAPAWKILDFGVSKMASQGTLTQNQQVVGTPGYMSPEQAKGGDVDERSDLFSLGSVLYRALTGQPPFRGTDTPKILFDVVYRNPKRPTEIAPQLPSDLDLVLAIAIAKKPSDRFANATELADALHAGANGHLPRDFRERAASILIDLPWGARLRD